MIDKNKQELFKDCWKKADEARGSVDGWDFKGYILGFLFYRYISEEFVSWIEVEEELNKDGGNIKYEDVSDDAEWLDGAREMMIESKGYFIRPNQLFSSVLKNARNDENLNETLTNIFKEIEDSTRTLGESEQAYSNIKGLLTSVSLNDPKLGSEVVHKNRKIAEIMQKVSEMDLSSKLYNPEIFGEAYEYLIGEYASGAGKSGGEFYTPPEVSELLVKLAIADGQEIRKVYDPACGSGSLLLKFLKFANEKDRENIHIYGQEINQTTYQLCKMNMYLHKLSFNRFAIEVGDTLCNDLFTGKEFDAIVSNPPYSIKWEGKDNPSLINDERFSKAGILAPKSKADMAFIQHSIYHLNNKGVAAIVCFPGILFREGAEKQIRQYLVDQNFVDTVIQLPPNLFFGTGISACIMVMKRNTKKDSNILFIDASELFTKVKNRNKLEDMHIQQIVDYYKGRDNVEGLTYLASHEEIEQKEYNLSVSAYVVKKETKEVINIEELNRDIEETSARINELRRQIDELIKNF